MCGAGLRVYRVAGPYVFDRIVVGVLVCVAVDNCDYLVVGLLWPCLTRYRRRNRPRPAPQLQLLVSLSVVLDRCDFRACELGSVVASRTVPRYHRDMSNRGQALLRQALALPADERADVAAELLASLDAATHDDPAAVRSAWEAEIDRRVIEDLDGAVPGEPWPDLHARLSSTL